MAIEKKKKTDQGNLQMPRQHKKLFKKNKQTKNLIFTNKLGNKKQ